MSALKMQGISPVQYVSLYFVQTHLQRASQYMNEFLAFMVVGTAARNTRSDPENVRFQLRFAKNQKFHLHPGLGPEYFSVGRPDQAAWRARIFHAKHRKHVRSINNGQALQRRDGRFGAVAFYGAQEADRNSRM